MESKSLSNSQARNLNAKKNLKKSQLHETYGYSYLSILLRFSWDVGVLQTTLHVQRTKDVKISVEQPVINALNVS